MIDEKKLIEKIWNIFSETYNNAFNFDEDESKLVERVMIDVQNAIEEQPKIGGWIPCSDRLPDKDGEYICTQKIYNLSNGKLSGKSVELVEFYNGKWRRAKHLKVIAWQTLPEEYHE